MSSKPSSVWQYFSRWPEEGSITDWEGLEEAAAELTNLSSFQRHFSIG